MITDSAFMVGKEKAAIADAQDEYIDKIFSAERIDGQSLKFVNFQHCTFANISFKEVRVDNCAFINCVFVGCYFRHSSLLNSKFIGCKFLSCAYPKITIQGCDFRYTQFEQSAPPLGEMQHNLPSEPNIRCDLARNLAMASLNAGDGRTASNYRLISIDAHHEHLLSALSGSSQWYRDHYDCISRLIAGLKLVGSKISGVLWGHGERPLRLLVNIGLFGIVIFPAIYWLIGFPERDSASNITLATYLEMSISALLPIDMGVTSWSLSHLTKFFLILESILGVLFVGLFVAVMFKRISNR